MTYIVFILCIIQFSIFLYQIYIYFERPNDTSRLNYLFITCSFLTYNILSGLFYDSNSSINVVIQGGLAYFSGIQLYIVFTWFLYTEYNIQPLKYFSIKIGTIIGALALIFLLVLPLYVTQDIDFARKTFMYALIVYLIFYLFNITYLIYTLYNSKEKQNIENLKYRKKLKIGYTSLIFITILPIITLLGDFQEVEHSLVNIAYFVILFQFFGDYFYSVESEYKILNELGFNENTSKDLKTIEDLYNDKILQKFKDFKLTPRQREITLFILQGFSYQEISEATYITEGTVTKHASDIFKKVGVKNKEELLLFFGKNSIY